MSFFSVLEDCFDESIKAIAPILGWDVQAALNLAKENHALGPERIERTERTERIERIERIVLLVPFGHCESV